MAKQDCFPDARQYLDTVSISKTNL